MNKETKIVGLRELREKMDTYVTRVGKGESFLVLRKSKPVFKMEPVDEWGDAGKWENLDLRNKQGAGMDAKKLIALIKEFDERERQVSKKVTPVGKAKNN